MTATKRFTQSTAIRNFHAEALLGHPVRAADLSFALGIVDDISPSPARAHTALVVLRSALATALGMTEQQLVAEISERA